MKTHLTIKSTQHHYDVSLIETQEQLLKELMAIKNSVTIIDRHIENLYPDFVKHLKTFTPALTIDATEDTKNLASSELVLQFLQQQNATKSTKVIAIGGGITQDIASFAAHIYYRGLAFIFVPTTLLAMSDSCIGGKCGLNYFGFKNQIGAFHSPEKVYIWPGFAETLPDDAIYSGYGEIFKLMIIGNRPLYDNLCKTLVTESFRNTSIAKFIFQALEIKKTFIEEDEFDTGVRRILNYGHTFGHALELATDYAIPHGIAVVYGLDIANYIAWKKGFLSAELYKTIHLFIENHFPKNSLSTIHAETLISNAQRDKKIADGKLNMIFLEDFGKLKIAPILLDSNLEDILADYLQARERELA